MIFVVSLLINLCLETEVVSDCSSRQVSLPFLKEFNYSTDHATEGDSHNFLFPEDNLIVIVQCMSNVKRPSLRENVIGKDTVTVSNKQVFRSFGYEGDGVHYWQEDVYLEIPLSIRIRFASKENFETYQEIINQVQIR